MTTENKMGSQKFSFFMYLISPDGLQIKERNGLWQMVYGEWLTVIRPMRVGRNHRCVPFAR
jgi:hypothetical protein